MKLPKKIQKQIQSFVERNYGFNVRSFTESITSCILTCDEAVIYINRTPVIGKKDIFKYTLTSKNLSNTKLFMKDVLVDDFIFKYVKEINRINYVILTAKGDNAGQISFTNLLITAFEGYIEDFDNPFEAVFSFWIASKTGAKLAYVTVKADGTMTYQCEPHSIDNFRNLLINEYCQYIGSIDEFFDKDGQFKNYDTRIEELKDTITVKEMYNI